MGATPAVNPHRLAPAAPDEEFVYGSCSPGWHTAATHRDAVDDWIEHVRDRDVERVCCLLPGRQLDENGANVDRYRGVFGESAVLHAPIPDHRLVSRERLEDDILPFLVAARDREERVVVHCLAGIGRTGQVLAAWLVYHYDYGPDRAIETVQEMGRNPKEAVEEGNATQSDLYELLGSVARL